MEVTADSSSSAAPLLEKFPFGALLMSSPQTARQILDRHYLEIRSKILDLAASLDRVDRTADAETVQDDPRLAKLKQGIALLLVSATDRAEQVQMLFSDAYVENWLKK
jgi:hypothetical protein